MKIQKLTIPDHLKQGIEEGNCTACFIHKDDVLEDTYSDSEIILYTESGDIVTPPKGKAYINEDGKLYIKNMFHLTIIKAMNQPQLPARRILLWHDNPSQPPTREYVAINPMHASTIDYVTLERICMTAEQLERWLGKIQFEKREQESEFVLISWKAPRG